MIVLSANTANTFNVLTCLSESASTLTLVNSSYNVTGYTFDLSVSANTLSYVYTTEITGVTKGIYNGQFYDTGSTLVYSELIKLK